ncbi:heavy metal transporter [Streptomyces sp. ACA25]|nr:heavy metal transporter [Streptomyces sp. ACA25]MDB1086887.1 heavy metal transporter [Streptomyces sp. ACA25]
MFRAGSAAAVLLGLVAYAVVHYESGGARAPHCTVAGREDGEPYTLQPQQAANAATIEAVGSARELPERAVTIAIATAMQESSLRNIDYGDRDSLGLFQQRPSMGWGSEEEIMDPVYASGKFYDHLVLVPDYLDMPLTEAAQEVQRSAFPDEYAKHEPDAAALAAALTGRSAAALNCHPGTPPAAGDPEEITSRLSREFGEAVAPLGGPAEVVVPVAPGNERQGWELAHWAVAHSAELGIARIDHAGMTWEARRSSRGWQETGGADAGDARGTSAELRLTVALAE